MPNSPSLFSTNAGSIANAPSLDSFYIQPTLNHGLRVWWAYFWPTSIVASVLNFCTQYWLRTLWAFNSISDRTLRIDLQTFPYLITAAVGLLVFRYLLGKRFRNFRIALLPAAMDSTQTLRPIWRRTVRVWWTFTWRTILYGVILSFLASVSLGMFLGMLSETSRALAVLTALIRELAISGAVGLFVIYSNVLDEPFGEFRVALIPKEGIAQTPAAAANIPPQTPQTV